VIEVSGLSLRYTDAPEPALSGIDLRVGAGELVLVTGPTGCGKSSLLGAMNGVLQHESSARVEGTVRLDGRDVRELELAEICRIAGTVFQNPDSQICTATPETEVAFGLENLGLDRPSMVGRIDDALAAVRLDDCRDQAASTLSGGQKQRLAIACALALKPKVLFLDEPLSQLDPQGVEEILGVIRDLKLAHELAVVLVEHRIEETIALADRVVLVDRGRIVLNATRDEALADLGPLRSLGLSLPLVADLFDRLGRPERPLRADEAPLLETRLHGPGEEGKEEDIPGQTRRLLLDEGGPENELPIREGDSPIFAARKSGQSPRISDPRQPVCQIDALAFAYTRHGPAVFEGLRLTLRRGDRLALMGPNGSGKSTLLHLMAGLLKPRCGAIAWTDGKPSVGLVMQVPDLMLFSESVREEVAFAPIHARVRRSERGRIVDAVLTRMGLDDLADQPPFALSRGQRLRTAVASILSVQPSVLLLDEPTTGQDREQIERMMTGLEDQFELVVFCTHDVQTAARHANRIVLVEAGRVRADGDPADVLFDRRAMQAASLRPTSLQQYATRHGLRVLDVESFLRIASR